ncbi:MAG: hypothetical protein R3E01_12670 [Pirellulaceae bacterium]
MNVTQEQIERIVREVVARVSATPTAACASVPPPAPPTVLPTTGTIGRSHELLERVVTLRQLEGKLLGVTELIVGEQTVVTPAVVDELKARDIQLVRQTTRQTAPVAGCQRVQLFAYQSQPRVGSLKTELTRQNVTQDVCEATHLRELVDRISHETTKSFGVVITDQPAVVNCVLNRQRDLRAAVVLGKTCVLHAWTTLAANAYVVPTSILEKNKLAPIVSELQQRELPTLPRELHRVLGEEARKR